jgi:hypothetical protein
MANGTNKGGKQRHADTPIRTTTCIVCGEEVTNRKSRAHSRGGRYCKHHGDDMSVLCVMSYRKKKGELNAA